MRAQAVQALYLSTIPIGIQYVTTGKSFSLTNADVLAATFNAAIDSVKNGSSSSNSSAAGAGGRRLMQAAPAPAPAVRPLLSLWGLLLSCTYLHAPF
jgi:hypothetical protein